jgi:hypothetical protein
LLFIAPASKHIVYVVTRRSTLSIESALALMVFHEAAALSALRITIRQDVRRVRCKR